MNLEPTYILKKNIREQPFSEELKKTLQHAGIETLEQLTDMNIGLWHKNIPGFTYHNQFEIADFLENNGLSKYIQEGFK
jgi:hypothetical protein